MESTSEHLLVGATVVPHAGSFDGAGAPARRVRNRHGSLVRSHVERMAVFDPDMTARVQPDLLDLPGVDQGWHASALGEVVHIHERVDSEEDLPAQPLAGAGRLEIVEHHPLGVGPQSEVEHEGAALRLRRAREQLPGDVVAVVGRGTGPGTLGAEATEPVRACVAELESELPLIADCEVRVVAVLEDPGCQADPPCLRCQVSGVVHGGNHDGFSRAAQAFSDRLDPGRVKRVSRA